MSQIDHVSELFVINGDVDQPGFPSWIDRHACRLGLESRLLQHSSDRIEVAVSGPPDLVDAMELGCSLGPIEVWVESIERESWQSN